MSAIKAISPRLWHDEARHLRKCGWSLRKIAARTGVHHSTVGQLFTRQHNNRLFLNSMCIAAVAAELGVQP